MGYKYYKEYKSKESVIKYNSKTNYFIDDEYGIMYEMRDINGRDVLIWGDNDITVPQLFKEYIKEIYDSHLALSNKLSFDDAILRLSQVTSDEFRKGVLNSYIDTFKLRYDVHIFSYDSDPNIMYMYASFKVNGEEISMLNLAINNSTEEVVTFYQV